MSNEKEIAIVVCTLSNSKYTLKVRNIKVIETKLCYIRSNSDSILARTRIKKATLLVPDSYLNNNLSSGIQYFVYCELDDIVQAKKLVTSMVIDSFNELQRQYNELYTVFNNCNLTAFVGEIP